MDEIRFVVLRGVLGFGVSCYVLTLLINHFIDHKQVDSVNLIWDLAGWLLAGLLFGLYLWRKRNREESKQTGQD
jgi:hypothetical protein